MAGIVEWEEIVLGLVAGKRALIGMIGEADTDSPPNDEEGGGGGLGL